VQLWVRTSSSNASNQLSVTDQIRLVV
jgi:hypothetical protein